MLEVKVNDRQTYTVTNEDGQWYINDKAVQFDVQFQPNGLVSVLYNNKSYTGIVEKVDKKAKELSLRIDGQTYKIAITEALDRLLASMGMDMKAMQKAEPVKAPMPGMILKVLVEPGQQISKGDGLLVLEAMKMENILKATGNATVRNIRVSERTAVEKGAILIEME